MFHVFFSRLKPEEFLPRKDEKKRERGDWLVDVLLPSNSNLSSQQDRISNFFLGFPENEREGDESPALSLFLSLSLPGKRIPVRALLVFLPTSVIDI